MDAAEFLEKFLALGSGSKRCEKIPIPGLGDICVYEPSTRDRALLEAAVQDPETGQFERANCSIAREITCIFAAKHEDGSPVFPLGDDGKPRPEHLTALSGMHYCYTGAIFDAAKNMGWLERADIEDIEKNSEATPPSSSPTGSRRTSASRTSKSSKKD